MVLKSVVRLGAWCDYVTEDELRQRSGSDGGPSPGGKSFDVSEFAVLSDGRRVTLHQERGWTSWIRQTGSPDLLDPWLYVTEDDLRRDVLNVVLPDDDDVDEDHPYVWLAKLCVDRGIDVTAEELRRVPYDVEFSDRLQTRVAAIGAATAVIDE